MSEKNTVHNRAVWFDIPVSNLERAAKFYASVLDIKVHISESEGHSFAFLEHGHGNGGSLILQESDITSTQGILLYMNVNGRIREAVSKVKSLGGKILQDVHALGPNGYGAVIIDSEGNRLALHSEADV